MHGFLRSDLVYDYGGEIISSSSDTDTDYKRSFTRDSSYKYKLGFNGQLQVINLNNFFLSHHTDVFASATPPLVVYVFILSISMLLLGFVLGGRPAGSV